MVQSPRAVIPVMLLLLTLVAQQGCCASRQCAVSQKAAVLAALQLRSCRLQKGLCCSSRPGEGDRGAYGTPGGGCRAGAVWGAPAAAGQPPGAAHPHEGWAHRCGSFDNSAPVLMSPCATKGQCCKPSSVPQQGRVPVLANWLEWRSAASLGHAGSPKPCKRITQAAGSTGRMAARCGIWRGGWRMWRLPGRALSQPGRQASVMHSPSKATTSLTVHIRVIVHLHSLQL